MTKSCGKRYQNLFPLFISPVFELTGNFRASYYSFAAFKIRSTASFELMMAIGNPAPGTVEAPT